MVLFGGDLAPPGPDYVIGRQPDERPFRGALLYAALGLKPFPQARYAIRGAVGRYDMDIVFLIDQSQELDYRFRDSQSPECYVFYRSFRRVERFAEVLPVQEQ